MPDYFSQREAEGGDEAAGWYWFGTGAGADGGLDVTVIAWDGKTMAGDRRALYVGLARTVAKIRRGPDGSLVGFSGDGWQAEELFHWFVNGAAPEKMPPAQRDKDDWASMLVVKLVLKREGVEAEVWSYERSPFPVRLYDPFTAIGAGRDYALAAMHLGKCAREAVEVASHFDISCGNGVDVLELEL